jgi:hypothetical protein
MKSDLMDIKKEHEGLENDLIGNKKKTKVGN